MFFLMLSKMSKNWFQCWSHFLYSNVALNIFFCMKFSPKARTILFKANFIGCCHHAKKYFHVSRLKNCTTQPTKCLEKLVVMHIQIHNGLHNATNVCLFKLKLFPFWLNFYFLVYKQFYLNQFSLFMEMVIIIG